jgi:hypothetical protein
VFNALLPNAKKDVRFEKQPIGKLTINPHLPFFGGDCLSFSLFNCVLYLSMPNVSRHACGPRKTKVWLIAAKIVSCDTSKAEAQKVATTSASISTTSTIVEVAEVASTTTVATTTTSSASSTTTDQSSSPIEPQPFLDSWEN